MDSAGSANLQSGVVLAVILLAVSFAERLGGSDQLVRRVYQVVLGATLAFLVIGSTTAFMRPPEVSEETLSGDTIDSSSSDSSNSDEDQLYFFREIAQRNSEATSVHYGMGVVLAIAGLAAFARWRTVAVGAVLAGLLLMLFGGIQSGSSGSADPASLYYAAYGALFGGVVGTGGMARDIAHFALILAGSVALIAFGFWRWERAPSGETAPA